jgi:hypothetical protein
VKSAATFTHLSPENVLTKNQVVYFPPQYIKIVPTLNSTLSTLQ